MLRRLQLGHIASLSLPQFVFPCAGKASDLRLSTRRWAQHAETVFACNAYHIGKERCYFQGCQDCSFSVWVSPARRKTLNRLDLPKDWMALLVEDMAACDVIISDQGVGPPQLQALSSQLARPVVGFQCTGAARIRQLIPHVGPAA